MSEYPHLPLFTDAFIGDTSHLNAQETGAYIMLLLCMWRAKDCSLPNDDKRLARMARCNTRQWQSIKGEILNFFDIENNILTQKRLTKERVHVRKVVSARSEAGKQGGRPKSLENKEVGKANGIDLLKQTESKPKAPIPIPIKEKLNKSFEEFYDAYNHKVSRGQAVKAWAKIPTEDHLKVIEGAKRAASQGGDFRQHPATWLNAQGWMDEIAGQLVNGELVAKWEWGIKFYREEKRWPNDPNYYYQGKMSECPTNLKTENADLF